MPLVFRVPNLLEHYRHCKDDVILQTDAFVCSMLFFAENLRNLVELVLSHSKLGPKILGEASQTYDVILCGCIEGMKIHALGDNKIIKEIIEYIEKTGRFKLDRG